MHQGLPAIYQRSISREANLLQKDFHFFTTYVLCRCNGMTHEDAYRVSYSCQHTDDAMYGHTLNFEEGGRFQQTITSWDYEAIDKAVELGLNQSLQHLIMAPFHFLPGAIKEHQTDKFRETMICRADSPLAQRMMEAVVSAPVHGSSLHRLGIALHTYGDTWAHQNFSGLFAGFSDNNRINDAKDVRYLNPETNREKGYDFKPRNFLEEFKNHVREVFLEKVELTKLGHAQVDTNPDEPYKQWSYYHVQFERRIPEQGLMHNWEIFSDAAMRIYSWIDRFLSIHAEEFQRGPVIPWEEIADPILKTFKAYADLDGRCALWQERIASGRFGFTQNDLDYNNRKWFYDAVGVDNPHTPEEKVHRLEGFKDSDWKHFHDAAIYQRIFLVHRLFPGYGIYCG